jgi:2'-5' RNA ligase
VNYRLFICVELPERERERLADLHALLRKPGARVSWVAPSNVHLTLVFLGDTPAARVADLAAGLDTAARGRAPFDLGLEGAGGFPSLERPRVLWVGVGGDLVELRVLQAAVAAAVRSLGCSFDEKPFSPHLTLGRVKDPRDPALRLVSAQLATAPLSLERFRVDQILLMRSELGPGGARYTILHRATLGP